jgi:hypothetical protein
MICIAPSAIVCNPDEQNRLTVCAGTSTGSPARSAERRATLRPCDASGIAHPHATSSTIAASTPARSSASFITIADSSTGCVDASEPSFFPLATAVRTAETITTSSGLSGLFTLSVTFHL